MRLSGYTELPASAVLDHVTPGMHVIAPIQNAAPTAVLRALDEDADQLEDVTVHHMDPWEFMEGAHPGRLRHVDYFLGRVRVRTSTPDTASWCRWISPRCRQRCGSSRRPGWR